VATGRLQLALTLPPPVGLGGPATVEESHDNEGCYSFPVAVSQLDDGTMPPGAVPHGDFCAAYARVPAESWDELAGPRHLACRFEGQTSWFARRAAGQEPVWGEAAAWAYGTGAVVTVFAPADALDTLLLADAPAEAAAANSTE
jgi:hypothetical protein